MPYVRRLLGIEKHILSFIFSFIEIGNEIVMEGMKIVHDKLNSAFDNEELYFYMESYEDCQKECNER